MPSAAGPARASKIPAVYMRGGTSKGVFFRDCDLPADPAQRDRVLLRIIGSPDPYGTQLDGMGAATSSTSKVVLVSPSGRPDCDVEYAFGQVSVEAPLIDWSGNCGNLTAAVGPFAIAHGLVTAPADGWATVRLWQRDIRRRIDARVPMRDGEVVEAGDFKLDGVAFPAAEIRLEFVAPGGDSFETLFPSGNVRDVLHLEGGASITATLIDAGNPTVVVDAAAAGLAGNERRADVDADGALLARLEAIRAEGAVRMGVAGSAREATASRPATPKIAFVAGPLPYTASDGTPVRPEDIDLTARIVSMGRLHHALTGTGSIALAVAAAIPGTIPHALARATGRPDPDVVRLGHPAGIIRVGAVVRENERGWTVERVLVSRSARVLMEGSVGVPAAENP